MKKILAPFITLLFLSILLLPSVQGECATPMAKFPYISFDRIAIGGIQPLTSTRDYVRSVYGEPDNIQHITNSRHPEDEPNEIWTYGENFIISFLDGCVFNVLTKDPNGLATPDGIKVGDSESKVISAYGRK